MSNDNTSAAEQLADALNMVLGEGWEARTNDSTGLPTAAHPDSGVSVTRRYIGDDDYTYDARHAGHPRYHAMGGTPLEAILAMRRMLGAEIANLDAHHAAMGECLPEELR